MTTSASILRKVALAAGAVVVAVLAVWFGGGMENSTLIKSGGEAPIAPIVLSAPARQLPTVVTTPVPASQAATFTSTATPVQVPAPVSATALTVLPDDTDMSDLRTRALVLPVQGIKPTQLVDTYTQARAAGASHDAMDIMATRGTPVMAVEDGRVAKLFASKPGGITIYHFDPGSQYAYYYAHLDRYADGLMEGASISKGQIIGYVGSTGNALPDAPHLHFAIFKLGPERQWWRGTPLNPFLVWRSAGS